jgi:CLIP-associating protein 1/2
MRPTKFRRPDIGRPATAGPYSVRRPGHAPSNSDVTSPSARSLKGRTPSASSTSPQKTVMVTRPNTSHSSHASISSHNSPARSTTSAKSITSKAMSSPRSSPPKAKSIANIGALSSSPSKPDEDFTMVVPTLTGLRESFQPSIPQTIDSSDDDDTATPLKPLKVYEDPFSSTGDQTTPRPAFAPVLGELPVNEDLVNVIRNGGDNTDDAEANLMSPGRLKQNTRLLDSGINKIKSKSLDVHGFRKLQGMIKENKAAWSDDRFSVLLLGLFEYLEAPLTSLSPEKAQDVKTQILATIKIMLKKDREAFVPYVINGFESLLVARGGYDSRSHIVSGLELIAKELVELGDPQASANSIVTQLQSEKITVEGSRTLSMGFHALKDLLAAKPEFVPSDASVEKMCKLLTKCIGDSDSGVRMDSMAFCVELHDRIGEARFWSAFGDVSGESKNLITYYVARRAKDLAVAAEA